MLFIQLLAVSLNANKQVTNFVSDGFTQLSGQKFDNDKTKDRLVVVTSSC